MTTGEFYPFITPDVLVGGRMKGAIIGAHGASPIPRDEAIRHARAMGMAEAAIRKMLAKTYDAPPQRPIRILGAEDEAFEMLDRLIDEQVGRDDDR